MKSDALKFLQQYKQNERRSKEKLQRVLLSQFRQDFLAYSKSVHTAKAQKAFDVAFNQFIKIIGDIPTHQVGILDIEKFLSEKKEEASVWTARKYYIALASAFETARKWTCIQNNPFRQVEKPRAPEVQPAYFTSRRQ